MGVAWALQQAIYDVMTNDAAIIASDVTGVFDDVDEDYDDFPYITIGEDNIVERDTDQTEGYTASITIHIWSREKSQKEVKVLQGLVYTALHRVPLTITGFNCILCRQTDQLSLRDPDGQTRHGVQTYELIIGA